MPNYMCRTYEGVPMVNGLHEGHIESRETDGTLDDAYKAYDATIRKKIGELSGSPKENGSGYSSISTMKPNVLLGGSPRTSRVARKA